MSRPGTVASSGDHECAVGDDGAVRYLGSNDDGGLGDGPTPRRPSPSAVALPGPAAAVAVAYGFRCARLADGAAWCWGRMAQQRAVGAPLRPTLAPGLRDVATILVDGVSLWALRRDGTVWSWDGGPESRPLVGLTSVASQVGHHDAWCALTEVGAVEAARDEDLRRPREVARRALRQHAHEEVGQAVHVAGRKVGRVRDERHEAPVSRERGDVAVVVARRLSGVDAHADRPAPYGQLGNGTNSGYEVGGGGRVRW